MHSKNGFARFVKIATASLFEVVSEATIGLRQGFPSQADFEKLYSAAEEQSRMLSGPRKSLIEE